MNIFNKVTLQSMKKSRTRTIVTVIGVVLSAAMITAVATFAVSLQNYLINGAIVKYGGWHITFLDVDSAFVHQRTVDNEVANSAAFENIGYAALAGSKNPNKPYLFIAGFSKEAFDTFPITLDSGRLPQNNTEILVPSHVAANGGVRYALGDRLSLAVGNRMQGNQNLGQHTPYSSGKETFSPTAGRTYTVVGFYERPVFEEYSAPGYTLITKADPADQSLSFGLFVTLKNPSQTLVYAGSMAGTHGYVLNDNVLRFMGLSDDHLVNALLYAVGAILVAIIMLGSIFLIYNSFNISLNERTRQFGILSSVGATASQLRNSVLFEGLCIGAVGIPVGVLVGIGSTGLIIPFVAGNFSTFAYSAVPLTLTVSVPAIIVAAVVSMITILISAYIPARKAANTPVMESILQTNEVKIESRAVKTSKLSESIYGLEGTLALKNFKRNKKNYQSIVLSLTLSVVLFVSASAFGMYLKQETERSVVDMDYDIVFYTQTMDESGMRPLYERLKAAAGVTEGWYQAVFAYSTTVRAGDFSDPYRELAGHAAPDEMVHLPVDLQFIEDSQYLSFIQSLGLPVKEYTGQNAKMIAIAKAKKESGTKNGKAEWMDMFAGRSMNFTIAPQINNQAKTEQGQTINVTLVDTYPVDPPPSDTSKQKFTVFMVIAPYSLRGQFAAPAARPLIGLTFRSKNAALSTAEMDTLIQGSGIPSGYSLYNVHKILEQNRNIIIVMDVFTTVFVIMISLIAVANVFNTISTNIRLRRRELAMLRSVGMSERHFNKMMNFECVFYGMRTLLFGLPAAGIISCLIYAGMVLGGATIDFAMPWASMAISVFGVLFIVFITTRYAVSEIKRENIIDALRDDMT